MKWNTLIDITVVGDGIGSSDALATMYYDASIDDGELVPIGDVSGANANILTYKCMRKIFGKIERMNESETLPSLHLTGTTHKGERKKTSEKLETLAELNNLNLFFITMLVPLSLSRTHLKYYSEKAKKKCNK